MSHYSLRYCLFNTHEGVIEIADGDGQGDEAGLAGAGGEVDVLFKEVPEELFEDGETLPNEHTDPFHEIARLLARRLFLDADDPFPADERPVNSAR